MRRAALPAVWLVVVLALATASMAGASQDNWRLDISADNGSGLASFKSASVGVYPGASDGYRSASTEEGSPFSALQDDLLRVGIHVACIVPGKSDLYPKCIKAPTAPPKTWEMYVAANINSAAHVIRPLISTLQWSSVPPQVFGYKPVSYWMVMLDNKGMPGAPAIGTRWEVPIPTTHIATPFWTCPVNLPVIKLSAPTNAALIAEGYKLRFVQDALPEPTGMLALGSGLLGLAGYAIRRRKA